MRNTYRGMKVIFGRTPRLHPFRCYLVDLSVPYSDGRTADLVPLGYATLVDGRWRAETLRGAVVAVGLRRRADAVHALYCQRFGNPDLPRHVRPVMEEIRVKELGR